MRRRWVAARPWAASGRTFAPASVIAASYCEGRSHLREGKAARVQSVAHPAGLAGETSGRGGKMSGSTNDTSEELASAIGDEAIDSPLKKYKEADFRDTWKLES